MVQYIYKIHLSATRNTYVFDAGNIALHFSWGFILCLLHKKKITVALMLHNSFLYSDWMQKSS